MTRLTLLAGLLATVLSSDLANADGDAPRPNVLWITSEDNGPQLGCYGDDYAATPQLDALAARGMIYRTCWSNAPVCAPARTTIISGMYPTSLGAEHMRSMTRLPADFKMYPQYLREAGYFCTNNGKEDYNLQHPGRVWDDSSGQAHWKHRAEGQPFFAIFNHTISHESKLRTRPHRAVHDPAKVRLPAYHPDTPEVRQDWAQYYDRITEMDALAGENLREIADAGLADDTIVFYYGDHGSGMPRSKRWPYNSGLQVPLIVFIPEKFKHLRPDDYAAGGETDRPVGFVDLAPTLLSLCGLEPPAHMHGQAFAGKFMSPPQEYVHGFRGRMDERYDMVRSVGDGRYVYIRNYMPHKIYGQHIDYMFQTPTTRVWKAMFDAGELNEAQSRFWQVKPAEELYDLENDPDEIHNLSASPQHQVIRERMRQAQQHLAVKIRDIGFLPEGEIHTRSEGTTPYEMAHDDQQYPLAKVMHVAEQASLLKPEFTESLSQALSDDDSAVRYWGAMGLLMRGEAGVSAGREQLRKALADKSPYVRIAAAEGLGRYGNQEDVAKALPVLLDLASPEDNGIYAAMSALNAIDYLDANAAPAAQRLSELPTADPHANARMKTYAARLIEKTLADLR
ncbi:MAG: sulfatase-like hydrolase/transferase [Pirellulaceae bacterium]